MPSATSAMRPPASAPSSSTPVGAGHGQTRTAKKRATTGTSTASTLVSSMPPGASNARVAPVRSPLSRNGSPLGLAKPTLRARLGARPAPGAPDELDDDPGQLLADVLLEEVTTTREGGVVPALGARNLLAKDPIGAGRDRVGVAERGQERRLEVRQHLPGPAVGLGSRV